MKKLDAGKSPVPFSLSVREFSEQNGSGGKLVFYKNATLMQQGVKRSLTALASGVQRKNPNHWENKTRNIKLENGKIRKLNILFIVEYNGKKVVY